MIKTKLSLSIEQKNTVFNQLLKDQEVKSVIHPADNILTFSLKNGVKLFVDGHWKYKSSNNVAVASHLVSEESIEDNFSKIEDLAEGISKKNLVIDEIVWINDGRVAILFKNEDELIVSVHSYKDESLFVSLAFSSITDSAHLHIDYENKQWVQRMLFKKKDSFE